MIKDVWFRGAATCMGPRERYSPGPSLTLNGPEQNPYFIAAIILFYEITQRNAGCKLAEVQPVAGTIQ